MILSVRLVASLMLVIAAQAASAEESWRFGAETDNMTEKRTAFVIGTGGGLRVEVTCKKYETRSSEYKGMRELDGKRYLTVYFVADSYLGDTVGIHKAPPALFRVDNNPALEVDLGPFSKATVNLLSGTVFINKLLDKPGKRLRVRLLGMDDIKHEYTLSLEGMPAAIELLKKDCGMTPGNTHRDKHYNELDSIHPPR